MLSPNTPKFRNRPFPRAFLRRPIQDDESYAVTLSVLALIRYIAVLVYSIQIGPYSFNLQPRVEAARKTGNESPHFSHFLIRINEHGRCGP